jgi:tungstate transport system substrate-binding protein
MLKRTHFVVLFILCLTLAACAAQPAAPAESQVLRLATTTSTDDSGLLDAILPDFEARCDCRVDVVAVGTGQALEIGMNGDADVLLVHARAREDQFVADGHGVDRHDVMYNDFILVGPEDDPAGVRGVALAKDALAQIAARASDFASRGDDSGTHTKEKSLWAAIPMKPTPQNAWYLSLGQGMGDTLTFANERGAYTLSDRATFLALQANLPNLAIVVGGQTIDENHDSSLLNPYGVIAVNPETHPGVQYELAIQFINWLTSSETQHRIAEYGKDEFGQALFFPDAR